MSEEQKPSLLDLLTQQSRNRGSYSFVLNHRGLLGHRGGLQTMVKDLFGVEPPQASAADEQPKSDDNEGA